jgi:hypothetical protein
MDATAVKKVGGFLVNGLEIVPVMADSVDSLREAGKTVYPTVEIAQAVLIGNLSNFCGSLSIPGYQEKKGGL